MLAAITMFFVMLMGLIGYTTLRLKLQQQLHKAHLSPAVPRFRLLQNHSPCVWLSPWNDVNGMWMDLFAEHVPLSWAAYLLIAIANLAVIVACVKKHCYCRQHRSITENTNRVIILFDHLLHRPKFDSLIRVVAAWYVNGMWMDLFAEHVPLSWAAYLLIAIANLAVIP